MRSASSLDRWLRVVRGTVLLGCLILLVKGIGTMLASPSDEKTPPQKPDAPPQKSELSPKEMAALAEGKALYRGLCSGCHGGDARGGKGPDLTDDRWLHGETDAEIARVILNGVPGTTMKKLGESLKDEQVANVIAYVRTLGRAPRDNNWKPYLAGNPALGKSLFFDEKSKVQCSKCHSINQQGGRIGPALDRLAVRRSPEYIMESILQPSKDIDPQYESVQVVTEKGRVITGLRVNETNFSIQLREENGRFHSFFKNELEKVEVLRQSLMPANHSEQMTVKELHDLFAYMMSLQ